MYHRKQTANVSHRIVIRPAPEMPPASLFKEEARSQFCQSFMSPLIRDLGAPVK